MAAHRYWRLYITENNGANGVSIPEIEMYDQVYGPNLLTGGTASASSIVNGTWPAEKAVDGLGSVEDGSEWQAANGFPQWWKYDFGAGNEKEIVSLGIHAKANALFIGTSQMVKTFDVQWSDDDSSWTTAWSVSNSVSWVYYEFRRFTDPSVTPPSYSGSPWGAHPYWRFVILRTVNDAYFGGLAELEYKEDPSGPNLSTNTSTYAVSSYAIPNYPWHVFDGNTATVWAMNDNWGWMRYDFDTDRAISALTMTAGGVDNSPKDFVLQFSSNTAGPWTTTMQYHGQNGWSVGEVRTYVDEFYIAPPISIVAIANAHSTANGVSARFATLRPGQDESVGGWLNQDGALPAYSSLVKFTTNDSLYINAQPGANNDVIRMKIDATQPGSNVLSANVTYRIAKYPAASSDQVDFTVTLQQNTTTIASWTHTNVSTTTANVVQSLSPEELAAITDYTDLHVVLTSSSS